MPIDRLPPKVFISYTHADQDFVKRLAGDLMSRGILVWWDEWEIGVGDSILQKVQQGVSSSSYLTVVLSPRSVTSPWVQEELNAAFYRQLLDRRVMILPVLIEDCDLPTFLLEKKYADFREDYLSGLVDLLKSIEPPDLLSHGEGDEFKYHHDYAFEWGILKDRRAFWLFVCSHSQEFPHSVYCTIAVTSSSRLSSWLDRMEADGFPYGAQAELMRLTGYLMSQSDAVILIEGESVAASQREIVNPDKQIGIEIEITARRLGPDPGSALIYEWHSVLRFAAENHYEGIRSGLQSGEVEEFDRWLESNSIPDAI